MRLDSEFLQLPLQFDAEQLAREAGAFLEGEWRPHPTDYKGNTSIILISSRGEQNDTFIGPMLPTPLLERCPYIQQVLASFNTVFGRSRLMRLDGGSEVPIHSDINYHWYYRVRLHIPIITDPAVRFFCNGYDVHMAPGEAWIFDTWKAHRVINPKHCARIHLVADTTGSPAFWDLARAARRPLAPDADAVFTPRRVEFEPGRKVEIETERFTHTVVMSPGEMDALAMDLIDDIDAGSPETRDSAASFIATVQWLRHEWRRTWTLHGDGAGSWGGYQAILKEARRRAESAGPEVRLASNRASAMRVLSARILSAAFQAQLAGMAQPGPAGPGAVTGPVPQDGPVAKIPKVGRNDDCPCGSGKKYKKCHGAVAI